MKNDTSEQPPPPRDEVAPLDRAGRRTLAESIVSLGSYPRILEEFAKSPGLLEEMTEDLREREAFLITEAPYLSAGDWRMLTCLELFDRATFEHCERTWGLAREKLEGNPPVALFHELLAKEGVSVESVLRACLLHDCGKMCLDKMILNDAHTDAEWKLAHEQFCARSYDSGIAAQKIAELEAYLGEHPAHRAIHKVPFEELAALGEREQETIERVRDKEIDTSLPLADLIATHQKRSGEILAIENADDPAVELVSHHHPGGPVSEEEHPSAISIMRGGVTLSTEMSFAIDVLRLSDIYDAYHSARVYKPGHPSLAALEYLLCESDRGVIDPRVATAWVKDSVSDLDKEEYFSSLAEFLEHEELVRPEVEIQHLRKIFAEERVAHEKLCARGVIDPAICAVRT